MTPTTNKPFSIHIFLPDGTPDGLRIVQKTNWTGLGVVCPRPLFATAKARSEFGKAGVYVLSGPAESGDAPKIYIGEAAPIRPRLEQHDSGKDFWNTAVFFVSKDENLNKAHIQYLEARLLQLAKEAKRCKLENANQPQLPALSEMDQAEVEVFLDEMLLCFPVLGLSIFEKPAAAAPTASLLHLVGKDAEGVGYVSTQGFVVRAGSRARSSEVPSIHQYLTDKRKELVGLGVLTAQGGALVLAQDYLFDSPSTAAGVLLGRSANGRIEWKNEQGQTLKSIQETSGAG
jgi:hypothetical protein